MSPSSPPRTWFEHTGSRHVYKVKGAEQYVIAAEVKTIGDTPLINQTVRLLDPDTGAQVGEPLTTDEKGVVRAPVPKKKDYRIEILDRDSDANPTTVQEDPEHALLLCHFVDPDGQPLAGQEVEVTADEQSFTMTTDDEGRVEFPSRLGPHQLKIGDQVFDAHALLMSDQAKKESVYRFVAEPESEADEEPEETLTHHELDDEDADRSFMVAAAVQGIGDTPLVNHKVRILDPDTGDPVADDLTTDDEGNVRAEVPDDKAYRIELVEDEPEAAEVPLAPEPDPATLLCRFVDASGAPIANQEVEATHEDGTYTLITDEDGKLEVPARLGYHELKIGDQVFDAHSMTANDQEDEGSYYHFVVAPGQDDAEDEGAPDPEHRLGRHELPPEDEDESE